MPCSQTARAASAANAKNSANNTTLERQSGRRTASTGLLENATPFAAATRDSLAQPSFAAFRQIVIIRIKATLHSASRTLNLLCNASNGCSSASLESHVRFDMILWRGERNVNTCVTKRQADVTSCRLIQSMAGGSRQWSERSSLQCAAIRSRFVCADAYGCFSGLGQSRDSVVLPDGLDVTAYGTHSMRRTKATLIYRRPKNLRAVQLLPGHTKLESTVRYLGVEVERALNVEAGATPADAQQNWPALDRH